MASSKLILGTVQFGLRYGIANSHGQPTQAEVNAILAAAAEGGIRMLDTAAAYGESETVLGRALQATGLTDTMQVVSKVAVMSPGMTWEDARAHIRDSLERSLLNLRLDSLYALLFHREADFRFITVLEELRQEGKLQCAGCSLDGYVPDGIERATAVQVPGNVLDRRFLAFTREAHGRGTKVFDRSVYLQGMLLMPLEKIPAYLQELVPYRLQLESLAGKLAIPAAELYMRYLLSIPEIDGVLTGVDTVGQLKTNMEIARKGALPAEVVGRIHAMVPELPERLLRPCKWQTA
ncbi:MAG: aldo/keto reductase [Victivallales bacterium]|nr:aldo/keto reductase [Victivallales bacterium]